MYKRQVKTHDNLGITNNGNWTRDIILNVLRKAILQELKYKYKNYESQDASFREYGFGATMVIIH